MWPRWRVRVRGDGDVPVLDDRGRLLRLLDSWISFARMTSASSRVRQAMRRRRPAASKPSTIQGLAFRFLLRLMLAIRSARSR
jgi:hypothetical protein